MIEPSLIGQNSRGQERNTDERDRDLDNHVGARTLRKSHEASLTLVKSAVSIRSCALVDSTRALQHLIG